MPRFEINKKKSFQDITHEYGESGTMIIDGHIINADYNSNLDGVEAIDIYEEMLSDTTEKLCVNTIELNISSTDWRITSNDESQEELVKDLEKQLFQDLDTPWQEVLNNIMPYRYGVSLNEIIYDEEALKSGELKIKDIRPRLANTIYRFITKVDQITATNIDKEKLNEIYSQTGHNKLLGIEQFLDDGGHKFIPKDLYVNGKFVPKLFIMNNEKEGDNYWGKSIMRSSYREWYYKDKLIKFHGMMSEKVATPMMYAIVSPQMSSEDKDKIKQAMVNSRANQERYIYLEAEKDQVAEVGFMDMKAGTLANALEDTKVYSQRIAESMDLNWKTDEGKGSQAKDKVRYADFIKGENSKAINISDQFNRQVLKPIIEYNNEGLEDLPYLDFERMQSDFLTDRTEMITKLIQAKAFTIDNEMENELRRVHGFVELPEDFERPSIDVEPIDEKPEKEEESDDEEDGEDKEKEEKEELCGHEGNIKLNEEISNILLETNKLFIDAKNNKEN